MENVNKEHHDYIKLIRFAEYLNNAIIQKGALTYPEIVTAISVWMDTKPFEKTEDIAIRFAEFAINQPWDKVMHRGIADDGSNIAKTTKELFVMFNDSIS